MQDPTKFSEELTHRSWDKKDAGGKVIRHTTPEWYGRMQEPGRPWRWVKLFTDKRSSQKRWEDMRRQAEQRAAGVTIADGEKLRLPLTALAKMYFDGLRTAGKDPEHQRISVWVLDKLFELGDWKGWADITAESLQAILVKLEASGATASYRNKFIARAKAFVNALLPEGWPSPLARVRRVREKGAAKTRARRAAADVDLLALLKLDMPDHRRLAYALAAFNGLRRNEARRLLWTDLRLEDEIPAVAVRHKQRQDDTPDVIPLHPYVVRLLRACPELPVRQVLPSVPDLKTLVKDWGRAGVAFKDADGRRLDYHALRHTFQTKLDRTGCSRATKKRLMRHAGQDVTDGTRTRS